MQIEFLMNAVNKLDLAELLLARQDKDVYLNILNELTQSEGFVQPLLKMSTPS
jgi:hypothetical protein